MRAARQSRFRRIPGGRHFTPESVFAASWKERDREREGGGGGGGAPPAGGGGLGSFAGARSHCPLEGVARSAAGVGQTDMFMMSV